MLWNISIVTLLFFVIYISIYFLLNILFKVIFKLHKYDIFKLKTRDKEKDVSYAIMIPARDESLVIENLLISIKEQSHKTNMYDVYVIVEDKNDLTVEICKKYGVNCLFRNDLSKRRKGYALDDIVKHIISKNKKYDMYFIMDADNVMDKNFVSEMIKTYKKGYDIGVGYRNSKNYNDNVVASASSLTFSLVTHIGNKIKLRKKSKGNVIISGTGFFISGDLIHQFKGFPFNSLTEDYELTSYCILNNIIGTYNIRAQFYDEQPTKFKTTINQRVRWIKGFLEVRKKYIKQLRKKIFEKPIPDNFSSIIMELIGITPYLLLTIIIIFVILFEIINGKFLSIIYIFCQIYLFLALLTMLVIKLEDKSFNMSRSIQIKSIFFNPIYLMSFVYCFIKAIVTKDVEWKKIEHNGGKNEK